MATLTYVYADSTAVLGPLATHAEPHSYDLCAAHAQRLTVPRGWDVVRLEIDLKPAAPSPDDLVALADAVREASRSPQPARTPRPGAALATGTGATGPGAGGRVETPPPSRREGSRRGHLRVLDGGE